MFGLGTQELMILLILVMIVFDAGKLPQKGTSPDKGSRNLKSGIKDTKNLGDKKI